MSINPSQTTRPRIQTLFADYNFIDETPTEFGNFAFFKQTGRLGGKRGEGRKKRRGERKRVEEGSGREG
jgi:hypothetical protein